MVEACLDSSLELVAPVASEKGGGAQLVDAHPELIDLTLHYKHFSKRLNQLIANIRAHRSALLTLSKTSIAVANDVAALAQNTPFAEMIGKPATKKKNGAGEDTTTVADGDATSDYISIHQSFAAQAKQSSVNYGTMVLDVVVQWESAVTSRINADLKTEEKLRLKIGRYQGKVDALRQKIDLTVSKGKTPKDDVNEKLSRDTHKLNESREQYHDFVVNLCTLMDEVVHRSWRDLQPVLLEMARHDPIHCRPGQDYATPGTYHLSG
jgi:hypothetical protein